LFRPSVQTAFRIFSFSVGVVMAFVMAKEEMPGAFTDSESIELLNPTLVQETKGQHNFRRYLFALALLVALVLAVAGLSVGSKNDVPLRQSYLESDTAELLEETEMPTPKSHCHRRRAAKEPIRRRRHCKAQDSDVYVAPLQYYKKNGKGYRGYPADPQYNPEKENKASTARWIAEELYYGFLLTLSKRTQGTSLGVPFGNPYSYALVDGTPYFYLFMGDASAEDALTKNGNPISTFSLSASSFGNVDDPKSHEVASEQCNIPAGGDPESPLCARLVFTGKFVNATKDEIAPAQDALFDRHPSMKYWPDHGWFIAKLSIDNIFFLDFYGWASIIEPDDYFNAVPNPGPYGEDGDKIAGYVNKYAAAHNEKVIQGTMGTKSGFGKETRIDLIDKPATSDLDLSICNLVPIAWQKPAFWCKPELARWLVYTLSWGALGTVSATTHNGGTQVGSPFGNIASYAEVDGTPYFYVMMEDPIGENVFGESPNSSASFTLTEAQLGNVITGSSQLPSMCKITVIGDPENPPCTRLVLSGDLLKVTDATELSTAKTALFKKHPQFETYPDGHGFFVAKLKITGIWMIAMYGWASIITSEDYFKVK
jgi:hypothetical protein